MKYKNYQAAVTYWDEDKAFHGEVVNISGGIHFTATDVTSLEQEFHRSVDAYLAVCEEHGIEPSKPLNGKVPLRFSPELHARAKSRGEELGMSLNKFITLAVEKELESQA